MKVKVGKRFAIVKWAIMGASSWIGGRPSIEKIIKENKSKGTIMVVKKEGKDVFILGATGTYGEIGENVSYVRDTGRGYGQTGACEIQNIIQIDENEIIDEGNGIGVNEKRSLWVFK
jgi:hypothetical protein